MGAPTLDLWVDSWNSTYPSDTLYTKYENPVSGETYDGYYIGDSANPTTPFITLSSETGYNNTLYYPHQENVDNGGCSGYWLASPSASADRRVMAVDCLGYVSSTYSDNYGYAFRPVVCLPSSIVNQ